MQEFKTFEGRERIATYCAGDVALVLDLCSVPRLRCITKLIHLASITGCWPPDIGWKGTQHLLRCKLLHFSLAHGFVLPTTKDVYVAKLTPEEETMQSEAAKGAAAKAPPGYEGATVLSAKQGFYNETKRGMPDPTTCLDFASLYPSIMMELNLCMSSRISLQGARDLGWVEGVDYTVPTHPSLTGNWGPVGDPSVTRVVDGGDTVEFGTDHITRDPGNQWLLMGGRGTISPCRTKMTIDGCEYERDPTRTEAFVVKTKFVGIIIQLLMALKVDRKDAKRKMVGLDDSDPTYQYWDGQQASIKVLMNSIYGGYGTRRGGIFPGSYQIAALVTARGRELIDIVKGECESKFWVAPGDVWGLNLEDKPPPAPGVEMVECIYGDTDSVFCRLGGLSLFAAAKMSLAMSNHFKAMLPPPHDLEFEKIFWPFLLYRKKMYSGIKYEGSSKAGEDFMCGFEEGRGALKSKGLAVVRRDNVKFIKGVMGKILSIILEDRDPKKAQAYIAEQRTLIDRSLRAIHDAEPTPGLMGLKMFEESGSIASDRSLDDYAEVAPAAVMVARRLKAINPDDATIEPGARVNYVTISDSSVAQKSRRARTLQVGRAPFASFYC